jgi:nucleoside triphosphate diphosphatase
LFVCVNLARHAGVDAGTALRRANAKFERRFRAMEAMARAEGGLLSDLDLPAQEALWQRAKRSERDGA